MYKLRDINGRVKFLLRTGSNFVQNEMPLASAKALIIKGEIKDSSIEGYPINVDNKWFFEGDESAADSPSKKKRLKGDDQ